jgi:hypothetical protein
VNGQGHKGFFHGERGDSLFTEPFVDLREENKLPDFFEAIQKTGDDRSYALTAALVAEHHVDECLSLLLPGYKALLENKDFTFSMRLNLLQSAQLSRRGSFAALMS